MEKDELKLMWGKIHKENQPANKKNIEDIIRMKHSGVIAKILLEQKRKIIIYSICLLIFLGLMAYAFLYLKISFLINSLIPFVLAGLFLFYKIIDETNQYKILSNTVDMVSVRDSIVCFKNKLARIKMINFISNMFLFYTIALGIGIVVVKDKGAIHTFTENGMILFLIIFILILLAAPWIINYLYQRRYGNLDLAIKNSLDAIDNE